MRKLIILIIALFMITGCYNISQSLTHEITEYYANYKNIDLKPGTIFNNILITIGDYNDTRTEPSSKDDSEANIYSYDDFEIETYLEENVEKIYLIRITSSSFPTNEGIKIGDSKSQMISIYGNDYTNIEDKIFIYNKSNTNISFTIENDIIIGIVYYKS